MVAIRSNTVSQRTDTPILRGIIHARITHVRIQPRRYVLKHNLSYLRIPISALSQIPKTLFGHNRFRLFSVHDSDYGPRARQSKSAPLPLAAWIASAFESAGQTVPDGEIALVTLPRVLGFGFNPVSFWLCRDARGDLRAILAEVNNTFGERHCYLCRKPDGSIIQPDDEIVAQKVFHVSPFLPVEGDYRFRFKDTSERLTICIDLYRADQHVLRATIAGRYGPLTTRTLASMFLRHPLPTLQVVFLIHYHAAWLFLAGHRLYRKPPAPSALVTNADENPKLSLRPEPR